MPEGQVAGNFLSVITLLLMTDAELKHLHDKLDKIIELLDTKVSINIVTLPATPPAFVPGPTVWPNGTLTC